jgi:metal-sulfur cluster biosynthetic enzyme
MTDVINEGAVRSVLRQVIDPEVGINVVDLGLIYGVRVSEDGSEVQVRMTMTTPACPMGSYLTDQVESALRQQWPALSTVDVGLVWDPPWSTACLSAAAKRQLGWNDIG